MPNDSAENPPNVYKRLVKNMVAKAEIVLKLISSPQDAIVETYKALVPEGSDSDFTRILELKGLKSSERQDLVARYLNQTNQQPTQQPQLGANFPTFNLKKFKFQSN